MKSHLLNLFVVAAFLLTIGAGTAFSQETPQSKVKKVEKKEHVMKAEKKVVKHAKVEKKSAKKAVRHAKVEKKEVKKAVKHAKVEKKEVKKVEQK